MTNGITVHTAEVTTTGDTSVTADRHPVSVYLARLTKGSAKTQAFSLKSVARVAAGEHVDIMALPWHQLRYEHTAAIRRALADQYAPSTVNRCLAAMRQVLETCARLDLMSFEDCQKAKVPDIKSDKLPAGRGLNRGELASLMNCCASQTAQDARDAALIATLYTTGIRRSEAVTLTLDDYNSTTGCLTVRGGKGNQDRTTYTTNGAKQALDAWLLVRGSEPGAIFVGINKAGRVSARRLTPQAVMHICRTRAEQAGVKRFSPHDLRRSFVSDMLDAGADIATVQRLAGHANPSTTARYDRRGEETKRKAAELLHIPYMPRVTRETTA